MMKTKIKTAGHAFLILPAVLACVQLAGCARSGKTEETAAVDAFDNLISIGFSQLGSESVWRSANTVSFQETFTRENGYFLLYENARQKQENQIKAIRSFISQRVDYIVFSPVTETGWDTVLKEAREAGIPVITSDRQVVLDRDSGDGLVSAWVGGDMAAEGYKAAQWLRENTKEDEKLNIVVLTGTEGSSAALGRSEGFHSISDTMENWNILEEKCGDFTLAKGQEIMEYYLDTYPDINVLVSQNDDMTFGAIEAMRSRDIEPGTDIIIISFDAVREALEMVRDGFINVDVECSPLLGPYVDELIRKMENGGQIEQSNPVDELVFTADNVEEYLESRTY